MLTEQRSRSLLRCRRVVASAETLFVATATSGALAAGSRAAGTLYGVGLGPGDPDLVTVKAARILSDASIVAYFAKKGRRGYARAIAERWMTTCREMPLIYPLTTELPFADDAYADAMANFYEESDTLLSAELACGRDVALICEGDPLFYGSFMHLFVKLRDRFSVTIVPGVTGMSGCWTAAAAPMTWGDDILTVLPATLPSEVLVDRLQQTDAAAIMKIGSNFGKVRKAIAAAGLAGRALYVERATMGAAEHVCRLDAKLDDKAPYFSIVLIPSRGRRR